MLAFLQAYGTWIFFGIALLFMLRMHSGGGHQHGSGGGQQLGSNGGCGMGHEHSAGHNNDSLREAGSGLINEPDPGQPPASAVGAGLHSNH